MNTYEVKFKLEEKGSLIWVRVQAENIDELSKEFRYQTYHYPEARIISIKKEKA